MVIHGWVASFLMEGFVELNTGRAEAGWKYGLKPRGNLEEKLELSLKYKQMCRKLFPTFILNTRLSVNLQSN